MFGWFRSKPERPAWAQAAVYRGLSAKALAAIAAFVDTREVGAGELVVREGEVAAELHVVEAGQLEVCKLDPHSGREHRIATVGPGDVIGEVGVIGDLPRTASVRALERCRLTVLRFQELRLRARAETRAGQTHRDAYQELVSSVARLMSVRMRDNAEAALASEVRRSAMGQFLVNVLILLCVYVILLSALPEVSSKLPSSTSFVSIPLQLVFAFGSWNFIRTTGYPLHLFGLSFRNAFGSLFEALVFTVPFLGVITALKWLVITIVPAYRTAPLIQNPDVAAALGSPSVGLLFGAYALSSVVQELIVRSAIQSSLSMFLTGSGSRQRSILLSALLFSVTHLHMSALFAVLAFVPGVFWGYLYSRRPNLLGVSVSHTVVGGYVFFVLGTNLG